jgi:hypothetical protein
LYLNRQPVFGVTFHQGNEPDGGQILRPWGSSEIGAPPDAGQLSSYSRLYVDWVFASRSAGRFCQVGSDGKFLLQDPDGVPCGGNENAATFCAELCWRPAQASLAAYGQSSNWYYAAVGTLDYTIEISDRLFNESFMHSPFGPGTERQQIVKQIATEFARNHREAIKSWFQHFLFTGHVMDAQTGTPVSAVVDVTGFTSPFIADRRSDPVFGRFWRLLPPGTYRITLRAAGYEPWEREVTITDDGPLSEVDVRLQPSPASGF